MGKLKLFTYQPSFIFIRINFQLSVVNTELMIHHLTRMARDLSDDHSDTV